MLVDVQSVQLGLAGQLPAASTVLTARTDERRNCTVTLASPPPGPLPPGHHRDTRQPQHQHYHRLPPLSISSVSVVAAVAVVPFGWLVGWLVGWQAA